ncbi:MAG TPA: hypothetical protein VFE96_00375 [Candidatus Bathyarchaeia archaeon]|nr:hypothetical protein [Candidatus Bathyarchaeia archaeon]
MRENESGEKPQPNQESKDKISRIDFLKYGIGAAAVVAGATALMGKIPVPENRPRTPVPNDSAEPIVASVTGDQLTIMNGTDSIKVKDAGLAAQIVDKLRKAE